MVSYGCHRRQTDRQAQTPYFALLWSLLCLLSSWDIYGYVLGVSKWFCCILHCVQKHWYISWISADSYKEFSAINNSNGEIATDTRECLFWFFTFGKDVEELQDVSAEDSSCLPQCLRFCRCDRKFPNWPLGRDAVVSESCESVQWIVLFIKC
jgi:hypothetical protein